MACHTLDPTPSQPRVLTDPIGNGPSAKFSASSQANLTLMLEISPNDTSSSRCKGEENIPAGLINHLPVDIPRKRKLCDIQTSLTSKDISEETKKQMIQVGREQPRLTNDSRPLSFEDTNEIPQEMRHLIRDRLQKNSSKAEVDEKEIGLHALILCSMATIDTNFDEKRVKSQQPLSVRPQLAGSVLPPISASQSDHSLSTSSFNQNSQTSTSTSLVNKSLSSPSKLSRSTDDENDKDYEDDSESVSDATQANAKGKSKGKQIPEQTPSKKKKRHRTTPEQLRVLEETYEKEKMPNQELREKLAKKLGMTPRRVQIWFQNKRAKDKRLRQQQIFEARKVLHSVLPSSVTSVSPAVNEIPLNFPLSSSSKNSMAMLQTHMVHFVGSSPQPPPKSSLQSSTISPLKMVPNSLPFPNSIKQASQPSSATHLPPITPILQALERGNTIANLKLPPLHLDNVEPLSPK